MPATIKIKNSSTTGAVPTSGDLVQGELAVNVTDTGLYTENSGGTVVKLNAPSIDDKNTGATKHLTISTGGNLGLGVTPSAWSTFKGMQLVGGSLMSFSNAYVDLWQNSYYDGSNVRYVNTGYASYYRQNSGQHQWYSAASGTAGNVATFTQAMTLDASGYLGIGTTSPTERLSITGNIALSGGISMQNNQGPYWGGGTAYISYDTSSNFMSFGTNSVADRMRIDSSGNLLVGTTSTDSGAKTRIVYGSGANGLQLKDSADTSNTAFVIFQNGSNSNIGTISRVGTTNVVAYNTTSDSRLKDDLGVATTDSVIDSLVIHDFTWKTDGTADRGVFAQEAALVKPLAVREGSDEVDENGVPKNPWGVDYSKFVPDLIVYSQQLKKQVQELETRLAALEQA